MTRRTITLFLITTCAVLAQPALAQSKARKKRQEKKLAKVAKKLAVPLEALREVGGERFLSRRKEDRRALLAEIGKQHSGDLVPLVVHMALHDKDLACRTSAVRFLSVVGLDGDRDAYLTIIYPALSELIRDEHVSIHFAAADEANRLARWFKLDCEVVGLLEKTFDGKHYKLAVKAWRGLIALENPELRESVVMRAMREVQDRRSRFAVFERRTSFRENGRRGGPWPAKDLAPLVVEDGTVAVACTQSLADLGNPIALPQLRRIDRTSAHVLRIPALLTRGVLQDEALLPELEETLASDHLNIKVALVAAIAKLKDPKVDKVLPRIAKIAKEPALQQAVALARLERGDDGGADLLEKAVTGKTPTVAVARQVLAIVDRAADPIVVAIARNSAGPLAADRRRAIARIGETKIEAKGITEMLRKLQERKPDALRLNAAATLLQLEEKDGATVFEATLKDYEIVTRVDIRSEVGKGRRFNGSPLITVLQRFGRSKTVSASPMIARWLDPPEPPKKPEADATKERKAAKRPKPPAFPPWLEHQFVRAEAVAALGELYGSLRARIAEPQEGDDVARLQADAKQTLAALARSLQDPRGVVRRRTIQALAPLADTELVVGASLAEEEEILAEVQAWLADQGLEQR